MSVYKIKEIKVMTVREERTERMPVMSEPEQLARFFREVVSKADWFDAQKECVVVICMNTRRRVLAWNLVSLGSATASLLHPREVFRPAILAGAACVAIIHNHPSGDPEPSAADTQITTQINQAGRLLGIELTDHVVIGEAEADPAGRGWYSFRLAGRV